MYNFPARLKELRESFGLKQSDLAKQLGMQGASISKYEQWKSEPDLQTLVKISEIFGVTTDYLLGVSELKNANCLPYSKDETLILDALKKLPLQFQYEVKGYINGIISSLNKE